MRRLVAEEPLAFVGYLVIGGWVLTAVFAGGVAPHSPTAVDGSAMLRPPSPEYILGTDQLGRDILSRVIFGSRSVLTLAPTATLIGLVVGTSIGLFSGYSGGRWDEGLMRLMDMVMAFPEIILYLVVLSAVGASPTAIIFVIGLGFTPRVARVVRSAVLEVRVQDFISAAKLQGESKSRILSVEVLPNLSGPLIVEGSTRLGYAIFLVATLSFLGMGVSPPTPDWGLMISEARTQMISAPWLALFPALAIASLVVSVGLAAEGTARLVGREQ